MADKPVTREEKYLAHLTGDYTGGIPKPITRKEQYLYELCLKGIGGEISPEEIKNAVNEYLEKNPVKPGATTEQAQQIEQNKTNIASLKEDKVDYVQNLAMVSKLKSEQVLGANATTNDDGSITVVPTVNYGRYEFSYSIPNEGKEKIFYFSGTVTGENITNVSTAAYCYSDKVNLGVISTTESEITKNGAQYTTSNIFRYEETQYNTDTIKIGIMTNTGIEYTLTKKSMLLIDVTDIAKETLKSADLLNKCKTIYGTNYWEKRVTAETAKTAQKITQPLPVLTDGVEITHNNNTWYSDILFSKPTSGKSYLCFVKLYEDNLINGIGIKSTISGYETLIGVNNKITIDDETYAWGVLKAGDNAKTLVVTFSASTGEDKTKVYVFDSTENSRDLTKDYLVSILKTHINGGVGFLDLALKSEISDVLTNNWKGKNALVIGDSITAANKWQNQLNTILGMNVSTHAKGGVGTISMVDGDKGLGGDYDNETSASGVLKPLSVDDVKDKSLIVVLPAYNDRGKEDGQIGDCYKTDGSGQSTIAGIIQYTINRIYETLTQANNLTCKVLYVTPHCPGRYPYIDADGYEEYPTGSGRTMETLANMIVSVGNHNNIPVCDLWHNSGSNKYTWNVFGASANPVNEQYSPYELDSTGNPVNTTRIRYQNGKAYYQKRDGQVVLETYAGSAPFPYNSDQLHCSSSGYARLGECIVGAIISHYGN